MTVNIIITKKITKKYIIWKKQHKIQMINFFRGAV